MRIKKVLFLLVLVIPLIVHAGELNVTSYYSNIDVTCDLLESNGNYLLIDGCFADGINFITWLKAKNVTKLDLFITHYDLEYSRIEYLDAFYDSNIIINKVYVPDIGIARKYLTDEFKASNTNEWNMFNSINNFYGDLVDDSKDKDYEVIELKRGDSFSFGDTKVDIIGPTKEFTIDEFQEYSYEYYVVSRYFNSMSLISMSSVDGKKYLSFGNATVESINDMLDKNIDFKADVLKLNNELDNMCALLDEVKPLFVTDRGANVLRGKVKSMNNESCKSDEHAKSMANYYSYDQNGIVTFNIKDGVISTKRCDNCYRVDVNYIDKDTKRVLDTYSSYYSSGLPYYLDVPKKEFKNYKYVDDDITDGDVIRGDRSFTVNYEGIPVVINHKYDSNSDEAKVVMLVQKYVNDNLRSKLYLNNLNNWNALSVEYIGDTSEGKEYYLKTTVDCAGDKTCIEDATGFDSNNNQYLYNAYVIVDGNSNVKLSFEKSSLVDDEEEIGEGEVENPKTGSYISLFIILPTFVIILLIGFMVRNNKLYKIN